MVWILPSSLTCVHVTLSFLLSQIMLVCDFVLEVNLSVFPVFVPIGIICEVMEKDVNNDKFLKIFQLKLPSFIYCCSEG